eukprot:403369045
MVRQSVSKNREEELIIIQQHNVYDDNRLQHAQTFGRNQNQLTLNNPVNQSQPQTTQNNYYTTSMHSPGSALMGGQRYSGNAANNFRESGSTNINGQRVQNNGNKNSDESANMNAGYAFELMNSSNRGAGQLQRVNRTGLNNNSTNAPSQNQTGIANSTSNLNSLAIVSQRNQGHSVNYQNGSFVNNYGDNQQSMPLQRQRRGISMNGNNLGLNQEYMASSNNFRSLISNDQQYQLNQNYPSFGIQGSHIAGNHINLNEINLDEQNDPENQEGSSSLQKDKENIKKVPKIISLYELYKIFFELSITIGFSMILFMVYIISEFKMPPDLILLPWLLWIIKKAIDIVRTFKQIMIKIEAKYKYRMILEFKLRLEIIDKSQALFYVLLVGFVGRFLFFKVIKMDFNTLQAFMKSLTRVFAITITFTITTKLDKDDQVMREAASQQNLLIGNFTLNFTNSLIGNVTQDEFIHSSQQWSSVFWPFWIYASIFILLSITSLVVFIVQLYKYLKSILSSDYDIAEMNKNFNSRSQQAWERMGMSVIEYQEHNIQVFKRKKKTTFIVSLWFCISITYATLVGIYFIFNLTDHLDTDYFGSKREGSKRSRKALLNSIYLIFSFVVVNIIVTLASHKYIQSWIFGLYGIEIEEKAPPIDTTLNTNSNSVTLQNNQNVTSSQNAPESTTSRQNQNIRVELQDEMLDLEKREFTEKMNFKVKIPQLLVKLSNTYYAKLSVFVKNFMYDGHQNSPQGQTESSIKRFEKRQKKNAIKSQNQNDDKRPKDIQNQNNDDENQSKMLDKDQLYKFTSYNNLLTDNWMEMFSQSYDIKKDQKEEKLLQQETLQKDDKSENDSIKKPKKRSKSLSNANELVKQLQQQYKTSKIKEGRRNSQSSNQLQKQNNADALNQSPRQSVSNNNSTCLICCDQPADSVIMDCGHGGVCFQCAITLCINAYTHNLMVAQRLVESSRHHRNRNPHLQMRESNCHICRQHISQIYQLEITKDCKQQTPQKITSTHSHNIKNQDQNQYVKVVDFFINEREFIIYHQYQKKLAEDQIPEDDSEINLNNSNLYLLRDTESLQDASRGQLSKYSRVLELGIDRKIEKISEERRRVARQIETMELRGVNLADNSQFNLSLMPPIDGVILFHRIENLMSSNAGTDREIPLEDIQIDMK